MVSGVLRSGREELGASMFKRRDQLLQKLSKFYRSDETGKIGLREKCWWRKFFSDSSCLDHDKKQKMR